MQFFFFYMYIGHVLQYAHSSKLQYVKPIITVCDFFFYSVEELPRIEVNQASLSLLSLLTLHQEPASLKIHEGSDVRKRVHVFMF